MFSRYIFKISHSYCTKPFTTVDEFLKHHGYNHINDKYVYTIYAGYDYGEVDSHYHICPLDKATDFKNPDLQFIELLLKAGANPNFRSKLNTRSIFYGICANSWQWNDNTIPLLKLLIKYGADVNLIDNSYCSVPLHDVALSWTEPRAKDIIELLIENRAKVDIKDCRQKTPYDNVLMSHGWDHNKELELPKHILNLLDPGLMDKHNKE